MTEPRRDDFPNNFVDDMVQTDRGWVVVPPTCCPDGHAYGHADWSVSSVWCACNDRHMAWRCWCGKSIYAPQLGLDCRIRDRGTEPPDRFVTAGALHEGSSHFQLAAVELLARQQ